MDELRFHVTIDGIKYDLPDEDTRDELMALIQYALRDGGGFVTIPVINVEEQLLPQVLFTSSSTVVFHQRKANREARTAVGF